MRGRNAFGTVSQDLQFALRAMRKNPGFALVAILVLALGTGANTAIFSVFHAVLLRPLNFHDPDRVMFLYEKIPRRSVNRSDLCAANFLDLQHRNHSFGAMAIMSGRGFTLTGDGTAEQIPGAQVSEEFFSVLGVPPERGRGFRRQDMDPGEPDVVVLSHGIWQRRFGGDPAILGRSMNLSGGIHRIVGVMPAGFQALFRDHELWVPLQLTDAERSNRSSHFLRAVGRLKPGVTPEQAQAELDVIGRSLEREYPEANSGRGLQAGLVHNELVGDTRSALVLLMGAVSLVFVVACVNVCNLLLARALSRRREMAIRGALGAGRQRLVQQLLTEGLLLAAFGAGVGLAIGWLALRLLPFLIPPNSGLPGLDRVVIDGPVLLLAVITAVFVSVLLACLPAWQLFRSAHGNLNERGATAGGGRGQYRLRSVLLAIEVALSLVLLLGAGLLLRSFARLMHVKPGFVAEGVLTAQLQTPPQPVAFVRQVLERVRSISGVGDAAAIEYLPLSGSAITRRMLVEGRPRPEPGGEPIVQRHIVTPDYFHAMGIPLRSGRAFRDADMQSRHLVVLINDAMARRYWPNRNPVGQYLKLGVQLTVTSAPPREIVGIVGDVRHSGLRLDPRDEVYAPLGQDEFPVMHLIIRAYPADPAVLMREVKAAVWAVDRNQPLPNIKLMTNVVAESAWEPRLNTLLLSAFAVVTLALALTGIYGLMMRIVGDRTAEIGIRMAMGARPQSVLILVLRQGFLPVLAGAIGGLVIAIAGGRLVATQLFGVAQADPLTFIASIALIVTAAFLAMAHPALRAARLDPLVALRHE